MPSDEGSGLLQGTAFAVPTAVGGAISYRSAQSGGLFTTFGQPVVPVQKATAAVQRFASQYLADDPAMTRAIQRWHIQSLEDLASSTNLSADQIRSSMLRASRLSDPTGHLTKFFQERLAYAGTGQEALEDLAQVLEGTSSIYAQRATNMFLEDVEVMQELTERGIPTTPTAFTDRIKRDFSPVSPGNLDDMMKADIARLEALTGAKVKITQVSRPGTVPGAELHLRFSGLQNVVDRDPRSRGDFTLRISRPVPGQEGVIVRGTTQQSRYIAGMYGLVDEGRLVESFNHEQWALRRATEDLIPKMMAEKRLTQRAARAMVSEFERGIMEAPEWIPSLDPQTHVGIDEYTRLRSQVRRLYAVGDEAGTVRPLTEFEYANIMERGGVSLPGGGMEPLFPAHSPAQIAKGVASTVDVRGGMALVPEAVPYGRRPLQFLRSGFAPTERALMAMHNSPIHQRFAWATAGTGIEAPMMRAAYVSSELDPQLAGTGITSEGQLLVSRRMAAQRGVRQWQQFDVASSQMLELGGLIGQKTGSKWNIGKTLPGGTVLGYGPDGRPVVLPSRMELVNATAFAKDKAKGDFIRVMGLRDITNMPYSKVFGGAKGMAAAVEPEYLRGVMERAVGHDQAALHYNAIDAIITMDELKKNRGLHYNQMFTALWDFSQQNMKAGLTQGSTFAKDPHTVIAQIRRAALNADKFDHDLALGQIVDLAREAELDPSQMGRVFGAVPEVYGSLDPLGPLSAAETTAIRRGVAVGATQLFFEGLGGPGAGRTATIEPRMFELLGAPHFGAVGARIQAEVAERMIAAYPERFMEQRELTRSLKSVMNLRRGTAGLSGTEILASLGDEMLPQSATTLGIRGLGDVYIPSARQVSQLSEYQTAAGKSVLSPLGHAYRGVLETAAAYEARDVTRDVMTKQLSTLQSELASARVGTITGTSGALRNRLPGSVFLTAVQPTGQKLGENVVGITRPYAEKMFADMRRAGLYDPMALGLMEEEFMGGGLRTGILGRHPYIGPYSSQAVRFQLIAGEEPIAMINERMQRAVAYTGRAEGEALDAIRLGTRRAFRDNADITRRLEQLGAERLGSPIRLSPFVGLAGDVDGDVVSAMFAGPQLEKSLTSHLSSGAALEAYEEYAIRSQVLKAKGAGDAITLRKAMAGDVLKLGITEGGRLGRLSVALQQNRAALLAGAGGLSDQARMDALGLLEWMEQTPISGKHVAPGEEARMIHLLDDIQEALDRRSANGIADAANRVLAEAKMAGRQALREGFTIAMEDIDTGDVTTRFIPGIDVNKTSENIMRASASFEASSHGRASAARIRELIMDRGGYSTGAEAAQVMDPRVLEQSPMGGFFSRSVPEATTFSQLASRAQSLSNRVGAAGKSMLRHARPLAMGTGVGLGLAALLSEPPRILPPGANTAPTGIIDANTGGANMDTDIHPEGHVQGAPTAPSPLGRGSAPVAPGKAPGYRVNIRGNTSRDMDHRALAQQLQQGAGGRARVNSTVRDQRTSLTPQRLSSILQGD